MAMGSASGSVTWPTTRDSIYETQVNDVPYSAQASLPTATQSSVYHDTLIEYSYKDLVYKWTFSPDGGTSNSASGSHTFTGLEKGAPNDLSATLNVTCTKVSKYSTWSLVSKTPISNEDGTPATDENGNQKYNEVYGWVYSHTTETPGTVVGEPMEFGPHTVYTHPGQSTVYSGLGFGLTIQTNLTSGMVAKWCEHCGKWRSWWFQSDQYDSANDCQVNSRDVITASWFNGCTAKAEASSPTVTGGSHGTVISADLFKQQDTLISRRE